MSECKWKKDVSEGYVTECGHESGTVGLGEDEDVFKFCPYCGQEVVLSWLAPPQLISFVVLEINSNGATAVDKAKSHPTFEGALKRLEAMKFDYEPPLNLAVAPVYE